LITCIGNCLFASLSDQLYGSPNRHGEIRATIIEHMRTFRPLYEDFVHANDVVQKRATRATTEAIRKQMEEDAFQGYLDAMSRPGTYGGQPELLAFVRAYDQDVMVHLPPSMGWNTPTLHYRNEERPAGSEAKPGLHICYGGDEEKNAHYDSSQRSDSENNRRTLTSRPKPRSCQNAQAVQQSSTLNTRAVRNLKSDPIRDMMHELVTRGSKDLRSSFDNQRARSPSVTSSHYSTSSKRSFEEDGDQLRASKRADRKRRSLRTRAATRQLSDSPSLAIPASTSQPTSSGPPTPTSSQDTDSSDQADRIRESTFESAASSPQDLIDLVEHDGDYHDVAIQPQKPRPHVHKQLSTPVRRDIASNIPTIITEQSRSALRT